MGGLVASSGNDFWNQFLHISQFAQYTDRALIAVDGWGMQTTISVIHLYFSMAERPTVNPPAKTSPPQRSHPNPGAPVADVLRSRSESDDRVMVGVAPHMATRPADETFSRHQLT